MAKQGSPGSCLSKTRIKSIWRGWRHRDAWDPEESLQKSLGALRARKPFWAFPGQQRPGRKQRDHSKLQPLLSPEGEAVQSAASGCLIGMRMAQERILMKCRRTRFDPCFGKMPWRWKWQPTPVFSLGKPHELGEPGGIQPIGSQTWTQLGN